MELFNTLVLKPEISIKIDEIENRKQSLFQTKKGEMSLPTFRDKEDVKGNITIIIPQGKKLEHKGIKIEFIGLLENIEDKNLSTKFITLTKDLEPPSILIQDTTSYEFKFSNVEKLYETYYGTTMIVRYFINVIIDTATRTHKKKCEIGVKNPINEEITDLKPIKLEVGIEDWLHIVFKVDRNKFHLKDIIEGTVRFKKVSIKLVSMELQLLKKEIVSGDKSKTNNYPICKFEIMDGAPIKNETIPFKWYISAYDLTPTYKNINNRLTVQYLINLVLRDGDNRRYFKQHEVEFIRLDRKFYKSNKTYENIPKRLETKEIEDKDFKVEAAEKLDE